MERAIRNKHYFPSVGFVLQVQQVLHEGIQ